MTALSAPKYIVIYTRLSSIALTVFILNDYILTKNDKKFQFLLASKRIFSFNPIRCRTTSNHRVWIVPTATNFFLF
ncbi:hypothetical protein MIS46_02000 [Wielerella bovis]|uniref:hypothetical protein n=1 Tax=Wielerella bovis TaxID=2917790 RepID=UPI002019E8B9|nr:hypothetical protein [Wielerella bovis]ULJ62868.1 hypothetical protein MIS46_02000 [Wielerella bovis]